MLYTVFFFMVSVLHAKVLISKKDAITNEQIRQSFADVCDLCALRFTHFHFLPHKNIFGVGADLSLRFVNLLWLHITILGILFFEES